jgi:hypothetical protein
MSRLSSERPPDQRIPPVDKRGYTDRARIITAPFRASSSRPHKVEIDPTFWIDLHEHTTQFALWRIFEEVGGRASGGYASPYGNAEGMEYVL